MAKKSSEIKGDEYVEALNKAWDSMDGNSEPEPEVEAAEPEVSDEVEVESAPAGDVEPEAEEPSSKERDDKGRFKSKEAEVEPEPEVSTEQELPPLLAPFDLSAEAKRDFQEWPRAVQEKFLNRYNEWSEHQKSQKAELDRGFQEVHDIRTVTDRYREGWALDGVTVPQAIEHFANLDKFLRRDPSGAIRWLAEQNGVDLGQIHATAPKIPPELQSIRQELDALRQEREREQERQQQLYTQSLEREVEAFASETDASGNLLRPYFSNLYSHMVPIVGLLKQQRPNENARTILQEAYEQASWSNPDVRAALLKAEETKRMNGEKKKAVAAKKAGSSISGAPGGDLAPTKYKNYEDMLAAAWDEQENRISN